MKHILTFEKKTLSPNNYKVYQNPLRNLAEYFNSILEDIKELEGFNYTMNTFNHAKVYIQYSKNNCIKVAYAKIDYFNYKDELLIKLSTNKDNIVKLTIKVNKTTNKNNYGYSKYFADFIKTKLKEYISKDIYTTVDCYEFDLYKVNLVKSKIDNTKEFFDIIRNANKYNL